MTLKASSFVQFKGLTVDHTTKLRRQMRSHGAEFKVTKNPFSKNSG